jgi:hypothetical protein
MCEGFSLDDVLALDAAHIAEYGYLIIGVESRAEEQPQHEPWAYTVGLLDAADHPELIAAGVRPETAGPLLSDLAHAVLVHDERYEEGDVIEVGRRRSLRFGAVNEIQYALDTFNMWHNLADYGAVRTPALEALQVVLSPGFFCSEHGFAQPLLADRSARVGTRRATPNRAARRSRGRRPPRPRGRA